MKSSIPNDMMQGSISSRKSEHGKCLVVRNQNELVRQRVTRNRLFYEHIRIITTPSPESPTFHCSSSPALASSHRSSIIFACLLDRTVIAHSKVSGMHIQPGTILFCGSTTFPSFIFFVMLNAHRIRLIFKYIDFSATCTPGHTLRPAP